MVYQQFAREIGECAKSECTDFGFMATPTRPEVVDRFLPDGASGFQPWNRWIGGNVSKRASVQGRASASGQGYHDRRGRARLDPEAKTGWQARVEPQIGWWVGWVETPTGAVIFALNIDLPGGMKDAPKREAIVRSILQSIGALPR